jgi:hypothetical protein
MTSGAANVNGLPGREVMNETFPDVKNGRLKPGADGFEVSHIADLSQPSKLQEYRVYRFQKCSCRRDTSN